MIRSTITGGLATLLWILPVAAQDLPYPAVELPRPTGPWEVGVRSVLMTDSARAERLGPEPGDPRALRVRFWYPTADSTHPVAPYMDAETADTWVERHGFPDGFERRVRGHARADAPLADGHEPWPLLVFSHGMSWPSDMYQSFFEELASHGYVVAAVDHTWYTDATRFPDGRVTGFAAWSGSAGSDAARRARLATHMPTWVEDLAFVLDEIKRSGDGGHDFHAALSTTGAGAFGHSYGGGAAARLMESYPRVIAAANLDGGAYGPDTLPFRVSAPFLHVVGGYNETDLVATEFAPDDVPLYEVVVQGAFHSTFSDLIYLHLPKADAAWRERHRFDLDPARALRIANDYLLAFFDRYVKGIEGDREDLLHLRSRADLLQSSTRGYPEVELRLDY